MSEPAEVAEAARIAPVCDQLTGIGNRRALLDAGEREVRRIRQRPRPLTLVLFAADHLRKINEAHGHAVGDAVLRHIATLLRATFRQTDVVARIGGVAFAVLLPSTDIATARSVAERFRRLLSANTLVTGAVEVCCTVSAGVATLDIGTGTLDELLKQADRALHAAKASGRNTVRSPLDGPAVLPSLPPPEAPVTAVG